MGYSEIKYCYTQAELAEELKKIIDDCLVSKRINYKVMENEIAYLIYVNSATVFKENIVGSVIRQRCGQKRMRIINTVIKERGLMMHV
jgi:uncharacterized protein (TIGR04540 family)